MLRRDRQLHRLVPETSASHPGRVGRARRGRRTFGLFGEASRASLPPGERAQPTARHRSGPELVPNFLLILATIALVPILGFALYQWHEYQLTRLVDVYLQAARDAEDRKDWNQAEKYLRHYLHHRPTDVDAVAKMAYIVDKSSGGIAWYRVRATGVYAQALELDPTRHDLRASLAELQFLTNPQTALETAEIALREDPNNLTALVVKAKSLDELSSRNHANPVPIKWVVKAYEAVLRAQPGDLDASIRLAEILRENAEEIARNDPQGHEYVRRRADRIMDDLVGRGDLTAAAHLARFAYREKYGQLSGSENPLAAGRQASENPLAAGRQASGGAGTLDEDLAAAIGLDPNNVDVRLAAAQNLAGIPLDGVLLGRQPLVRPLADRLEAALAHARYANQFAGYDPRPAMALSELLVLQGKLPEAEEVVRKADQRIPVKSPSLLARLAELQIQLRRWEDAGGTLARLEEAVANSSNAGGRGEAIDEVMAVGPFLRSWWYRAEENPKRDLMESAASLRQAAERSRHGKVPTIVHLEIGRSLLAAGLHNAAMPALTSALKGMPESIAVRLEFAEGLRRNSRIPEALREYRSILAQAERRGDAKGDEQARIGAARCLLLLQTRISPENRNWTEFDALIGPLLEEHRGGATPVFLALAAAFIRGRVADEEPLLSRIEAESKDHLGDVEFWRLALRAYVDTRKFERADEALDRIETLERGPQPELRNLLELSRTAKRERVTLLAPYVGSGSTTAISLGGAAGAEPSKAPSSEEQLAGVVREIDRVAALGDERGMEALAARVLQTNDAGNPAALYFQVRRALLDDRDRARSAARAKEHANKLLLLRPSWGVAHRAVGLAAEAEGREEKALESFRRAYRGGDHDSLLLGKLLGRLLLEDHLEEAAAIAEKHEEPIAASAEAVWQASTVFLRLHQPKKAEKLAATAAKRRPSDPIAWIALGRCALADPSPEASDRALAMLEKASAAAPGDLRPRLATLYFFASQDQRTDRSIRLLESSVRARELLRVRAEAPTSSQRDFVVGYCLSFAGDALAAEPWLRRLVGNRSDDSIAPELRSMGIADGPPAPPRSGAPPEPADGSSDLRPAAIEPGDLSALPAPVRAVLGLVLLRATSAGERAEAMALLPDDHRIQAVAHLLGGGAQTRSRAAELMDKPGAIQLPDGDHWLLGRLYLLEGKTELALKHLRESARQSPSVDRLIDWFHAALATKSSFEIDPVLTQLARHGGDRRAFECRLRGLAAMGRAGEAAALARVELSSKASRSLPPEERALRGMIAARILANAGQAAVGLAVLDQATKGLADADAWLALGKAGAGETYAACLDTVLKAAERDPTPQRLTLLARTVGLGDPTDAQEKRIAALLGRGGFPDENARVEFLRAAASVRAAGDHIDQAIPLAASALKIQPNNAACGLQWLTLAALRPPIGEQVWAVLRRVEGGLGPDPDVIECAGGLLLAAGRVEEAASLLEANLLGSGFSSSALARLTTALRRLDRAKEAQAARDLAILLGTTDLPRHVRRLLESGDG